MSDPSRRQYGLSDNSGYPTDHPESDLHVAARTQNEGDPIMPKRYRKKPVEVEAAHYKKDIEGQHNAVRIRDWINENGGRATLMPRGGQPPCIAINTLEGIMETSFGDYVIRGVEGEFYPCKPGIFATTYEAVDA